MSKILRHIDRWAVIAALLLTVIGGLGSVYVKAHDAEIFQARLTTRASNCKTGTLYDKKHPNGVRQQQCNYQGNKGKLYELADWSISLATWGPFIAAFFSSTMLYGTSADGRRTFRKKDELRFLSFAWTIFIVFMAPIGLYLVIFI